MVLFILVIVVLLCGCWDQRRLKNTKFMVTIGFDQYDEEQIEATTAIRLFQGIVAGEGEAINEIVSGRGFTVRDTLVSLNRKIADDPLPMKLKTILVSEDLAKKDIFELLDTFYRTPETSLEARVMVTKGKTSDYINLRKIEGTLVGEHLADLVISAENDSMIPHQSAQALQSYLYDEGKDIVLPIVKLEEGVIELGGLALFHKKKMTGEIPSEDSEIYMALTGKVERDLRFTEEVSIEEKKEKKKTHITIRVKKLDRKLKVKTNSPDKIEVNIDVKLKADAVEFPPDHLDSKEIVESINKSLSKTFTERAKTVVQTLQEASCDGFGIGRELMAYHPKTWEKIDWKKTYPEIKIKPKIEIEVTGGGLTY